MDEEFKNLIKVWITATTCLIYCYYISSKLPKGIFRLLSILPVFYIFTTIPFNLTSISLGTASFFFLFTLGNFKLLLFSFDQGPLWPPPPNILHFISIASLPIKLTNSNHSQNPNGKLRSLTLKSLLFVFLNNIYNYNHLINHYVVLFLYCVHLCVSLEMLLAICASPVWFLGLEIEPHFNEPHLSMSLQNFWGRRWNLMVTSILRPAIYYPMRRISTYFFGPNLYFKPAIVATFVVSGLMHEVIFFYMTRVSPTWEVTWFFVLQGVCVATEVMVKKIVGDRWKLYPVISRPLTIAFVAATSFRWFFPPLTRNGMEQKAAGEYNMVVNFVSDKVRKLISTTDPGI